MKKIIYIFLLLSALVFTTSCTVESLNEDEAVLEITSDILSTGHDEVGDPEDDDDEEEGRKVIQSTISPKRNLYNI